MLKEAERELAETTRLGPNETAVWTALGQIRAAQKKLDEAAGAYKTALTLDPLDEEAAAGLGAALRARESSPMPSRPSCTAMATNTKSPVLWNNLGVVRVDRGAYPAAIEAFEKALAIDASFDSAKANLARTRELADAREGRLLAPRG